VPIGLPLIFNQQTTSVVVDLNLASLATLTVRSHGLIVGPVLMRRRVDGFNTTGTGFKDVFEAECVHGTHPNLSICPSALTTTRTLTVNCLHDEGRK
jgi:hypothetical protein